MAMTPQQAALPRNTLNNNQKYRVMTWLNMNWKKVEATRPTKPMVCAQMSEAMGFLVTPANLQMALKGINKRFPTPDKTLTPEIVQKTIDEAHLRGQIANLQETVGKVATALIHLMNELGSETPVDLADVVAEDDTDNEH